MGNKQIFFDWINAIIKSCTDDFQFECVDNMVSLFFERFNDIELHQQLTLSRASKWNEIHGIIAPHLNK